MKITHLFLVTLMIIVLVSGCSNEVTLNKEKVNTKMPNPAAVYCEEHEGKVDIRTNSDGSQMGYCIFPDNSECEEWAFYRGGCVR